MKINQKSSLCSIEKKAHDTSHLNPSRVYLRTMYCELRSIVQNELRRIENILWFKLADEIQGHADTNETHKLAYGQTTNATAPMKSRDGTRLIMDNEEILRRWTEHYSPIYHTDPPSTQRKANHDSLSSKNASAR